jgi:uncharacterized cupin superfamily protein
MTDTAPTLPAVPHATDLLGMELTSIGRRASATAGDPQESVRELYNDGTVQMGLWECTPGTFATAKDGITESAQILSGAGVLRGDDGIETEVRAGEIVTTPDGWRGTWTITETMRKVYVVWPTAGG